MMRIASAFLLSACVFAVPVAAQAEADSLLRPGSGEVDGRVIPEGAEMLVMYADPENRRMDASITLRTRVAEVEGTDAIVRTETFWQGDEVVRVDSFVVHRRTLAPLLWRSAGPRGSVSVDFTPAGVAAVRLSEWGNDTTETPLAEPVFLAGTTDMLLGALPLAEGWSARLAVYDVDEGVTSIGVRVLGAAELVLPGGERVAAWEVAVREGGPEVTYWMDRESHTLVQFEGEGGVIRYTRQTPSPQPRRETR